MATTSKNDPNAPPSSTWWDRESQAEAADALIQWSDECIAGNRGRAAQAYVYQRGVEGYSLQDISNHGHDVNGIVSGLMQDLADGVTATIPVIINKARSLVMSFVAKASANDTPVPQHVTNGADYEQELRAENLDEVIFAELSQPHGMFKNCAELDRFGVTMATASVGRYWVFALPGLGKVEAEVDDGLCIGMVREGRFGRIVTLCRSVWKDPEVLAERYPNKRAEIMRAVVEVTPHYQDPEKSIGGPRGERALEKVRAVRVVQGWRVAIPQKEGKSKKGREMFALAGPTKGCWLDDNDWGWDSPPGDYWDFETEIGGDNPVPLTQSIYRMFMRENQMLHSADRAEHKTPYVLFLCQKGTGDGEAIKGQLTHTTGVKCLDITGKPGDAFQAVDLAGIKRQAKELIEIYDSACHEVTGIARNQSGGSGQPGTSSGIHELYRASYFTERFADQERRLVEFRTVVRAKLFGRALCDVVDGRYSVWVGDKRKRRQLKSADFDLDESKYTIQVKAASEEKDSPAARLKKAEGWMKDPAVPFTGGNMIELFKTFDTDRFSAQLDAVGEMVREQIERWRKASPQELGADGFYQPPRKYWRIPGLELALSIVSVELEHAIRDGLPKDRVDYHVQFADQCVELIYALKRQEAEIMAEAQANAQRKVATNGSGNTGSAGSPGPGNAG
jgi:hypothetical protein